MLGMAQKPRRGNDLWACNKCGHTEERPAQRLDGSAGFTIVVPSDGRAHRICPKCWADFVAANVGKMERLA